jgi:oxygen-independent coproporphyrinogen-3 oxidase
MYEQAIERLDQARLHQYEISNFSRLGLESRHNIRYWQRKPYLGLGLDASSMLRRTPLGVSTILRATTTDDLKRYLSGPAIAETACFTRERQHEEAWFLGLRMNAGVDVAALKLEFGEKVVEPAVETVERLVDDRLLTFDGKRVRLTARGRLISNEVFQEFLTIAGERASTIAGG